MVKRVFYQIMILIVLLVLVSPCFAIRVAVIGDIHYGATDRQVTVDKPFRQIGSTASTRCRQFLNTAKRYQPDAYVFLGDLVDGVTAADPAAQITIFKADVAACGLTTIANTKFFFVSGNHEGFAWGSYDTGPHDFFTEIGTAHHGMGPAWWFGAANKTAWFKDVGGFRLMGLATSLDPTAGGNFEDAAYGSGATNQQEWMNTNLNTVLPVIVFSHAHLTTASGVAYAYDSDETGNAKARTEIEANGNVIAVFSGHYHKGLKWKTRNMVHVVNGIPYYGLRGSLLGDHLADFTSNTFYIFDIRTTGAVKCREFQMIKNRFGRYRYSIGIIEENRR